MCLGVIARSNRCQSSQSQTEEVRLSCEINRSSPALGRGSERLDGQLGCQHSPNSEAESPQAGNNSSVLVHSVPSTAAEVRSAWNWFACAWTPDGLFRRQSGEASIVHFSEIVGGLNYEFGLTMSIDLSCHEGKTRHSLKSGWWKNSFSFGVDSQLKWVTPDGAVRQGHNARLKPDLVSGLHADEPVLLLSLLPVVEKCCALTLCCRIIRKEVTSRTRPSKSVIAPPMEGRKAGPTDGVGRTAAGEEDGRSESLELEAFSKTSSKSRAPFCGGHTSPRAAGCGQEGELATTRIRAIRGVVVGCDDTMESIGHRLNQSEWG